MDADVDGRRPADSADSVGSAVRPEDDPAELTEALKGFVESQGIDLFGIADVDLVDHNARPGRRPSDMYPSARALMIVGFGLLDPFTRGWVRSGNSGKFYSLALLELDAAAGSFKRFCASAEPLRRREAYGGGLFSTGVGSARSAASAAW